MSVIQSQSLYLAEQMSIDLLQAMALCVFLMNDISSHYILGQD